MSKTAIFMANGCEEIEGLTVVDLLRRAGLDVTMVSINETASITGSHGITFLADAVFDSVNFDEYDAIVLPGGMPGTLNLGKHEGVCQQIKNFASHEKLICAICAAPSVLGAAGILENRHAACHPGFEDKLTGAVISEDPVVTDGNLITSRGMGTAIAFGLAIVKHFKGDEAVDDLKQKLVYS